MANLQAPQLLPLIGRKFETGQAVPRFRLARVPSSTPTTPLAPSQTVVNTISPRLSRMGILGLPDELLLDIIKSLFAPDEKGRAPLDGVALARVSSRFYRLATAELYKNLEVDFDRSPNGAQLLHRTLSENPALHSYCYLLQLNFPSPHAPTAKGSMDTNARFKAATNMAMDIVGWLTDTREMSVDGHFCHPDQYTGIWSIVQRAIRCMAKLNNLSLGTRQLSHVSFEKIARVLVEAPQLRTLSIGLGVTESDGGLGQMVLKPTPEMVGSSSITSFSINLLLAVPEALATLLSIPSGLQSFSYRGLSDGEVADCFWFPPLQDLLSTLTQHHNTLQTLCVPSPGLNGTNNNKHRFWADIEDVDLSAFTKLEAITVVDAVRVVWNENSWASCCEWRRC